MTLKPEYRRGTSDMALREPRKTLFYSLVFLTILLLFYASLYVLWLVKPALYHQILTALGVGPWEFPFLDTRGWLSWLECRGRGFDILVRNACDPLNDTLTYSPLFLDFPTWLRTSDTQAVALAQTAAFLLTLPFLFRPSSLHELCVACLATMSTSVVFAIERSNLDVFIFTLIAVAVFLRRRFTALRFSPYAAFIAGGMLKFYPLVLLSTALRERPRAFLFVAGVSAAIVTGVTAMHWTDLQTIFKSQPPLIVWGDTFGARELPIGVAYFFPGIKLAPLIAIEVACVAFFYLIVQIFSAARKESHAFQWDDPNSECLIFGSILIVGCFFAGENSGYRSIFLLFLLPGLRDSAARVSLPGLRGVLSLVQIAIILLLWKDFFRHGIDGLLGPTGKEQGFAELPYLLFFALRELNWWFVIAVASAVAVLFLSRSQTVRWTLSLVHRTARAAI